MSHASRPRGPVEFKEPIARPLGQPPGLRLVRPIGQACVIGEAGHCLACGSAQGEPCRRRHLHR